MSASKSVQQLNEVFVRVRFVSFGNGRHFRFSASMFVLDEGSASSSSFVVVVVVVVIVVVEDLEDDSPKLSDRAAEDDDMEEEEEVVEEETGRGTSGTKSV